MSDGKQSRTVGRVFGRLTVIERLRQVEHRCYLFLCKCECGKEVEVHSANLYTYHTRSCGCLLAEMRPTFHTTHGMAGSPEHGIWEGMRQRCNNTDNEAYSAYGGRGITVCTEWNASFTAFYRDMGPRPSPDHTLDRIDNDHGYSPDNCKWSTWTEQARNRRSSRRLEFRGETKTVAEWCEKLGIHTHTLFSRLVRGWSAEAALGTAVRPIKPKRVKR